jgi:hypothetical protein
MDNKDLMVPVEMSNAEFGSALLAEAQKRRQKEKLEKSVLEAETILARLDDCTRQIEHLTGWKKTCNGQMEALQKGDFSLDNHGMIVYNDSALNRR